MFTNLIDFQKTFSTELKCIKYLEKLRWNGEKPICPRCKKNHRTCIHSKAGLYSCSDCKREFTIRKGTIFEDSPLKLTKWFMGFYFEISSAKTISSYSLSDKIGTTQRTAWFVQQRIRWVLKHQTIEKIERDIEIDETYVGGKEVNKHQDKKKMYSQSSNHKMAVVGILQSMLGMKYINKTNIQNIKPVLPIFGTPFISFPPTRNP